VYCIHSNPAGAFRPVRPRELRLIPRGAQPRSGLATLCVSPTTRWGLLYYSVPAAALTDDRIVQLQCGKCSKRSQAGKVTFRLIQAVILAERSRQERENRRDAHGSGDQMLPPDAVRQPQRVPLEGVPTPGRLPCLGNASIFCRCPQTLPRFETKCAA
jgi:hypothetical protein